MLQSDPQRMAKVIKTLMDWYANKDGLLSGAEPPESKPPSGMEQGSYEHIMFLTLSVSLDYQRSANDLWNSARTTWEDTVTRWVFYPNEIKEKNFEELVSALSKYKLSKKPTKDTQIWQRVSNSFLELFDGDPRNLFKKFDYDALQIFNAMRKQYGKRFPYLAGSTGTSKILSLWIRILNMEAGIQFKNLDKVPLPIDIHTARATITTGCLFGKFDGTFGDLVIEAKKAWIDACRQTQYYPLQLDEPLWNLSRFGCSKHASGDYCPLRKECRLAEFCTAVPHSIISLKQNGNTTIQTGIGSTN
ncbi:MAG: hypothetical protein FJ357_07930 [Thaumarchaeota archaeon]|nr:hypothetical protein [Nitrososphaerota archaeon]